MNRKQTIEQIAEVAKDIKRTCAILEEEPNCKEYRKNIPVWTQRNALRRMKSLRRRLISIESDLGITE